MESNTSSHSGQGISGGDWVRSGAGGTQVRPQRALTRMRTPAFPGVAADAIR